MAYLEVDVSSPVPVYQQVMDQIRRFVSDGMIAPGSPLPSVRQLAAELGINPNTVAKAYQFLELEGTIVTRRRRGAYVGESSSALAALARERRLGDVVERFIEEAERLGAAKEDIVQAVAERIRSAKGKGARAGTGTCADGGAGGPGSGRRSGSSGRPQDAVEKPDQGVDE